MNHCLINYSRCGDALYSKKGLSQLSKNLSDLQPLDFLNSELNATAVVHAEKMSIQGVQPKLGAVLNVEKQQFELVGKGSTYILKPQSVYFDQLPENESVTMCMAKTCGIEIPILGLVKAKDHKLVYFIKRFDRLKDNEKLIVEDFAQLSGGERDNKYDASMERVQQMVDTYCTFPKIEKMKLFKLTLFNFLVGNEDAHLKNWSVIQKNGKTFLSPAYDLVNSTIFLGNGNVEEIALPINGKKRKLTYDLLVNYFGRERLKISDTDINMVLENFKNANKKWRGLLKVCFLNPDLKEKYNNLLDQRQTVLFS